MAKMAIPDSPSLRTTRYRNLSGVDYSVDPSEVDKNKTPDGLNMVTGNDGNPEKRVGWRKLSFYQDVTDMEIIPISTKRIGGPSGNLTSNISIIEQKTGYVALSLNDDDGENSLDFAIYDYFQNTWKNNPSYNGNYDYNNPFYTSSEVSYLRNDYVKQKSNHFTTFQYDDTVYLLYGCRLYRIKNAFEDSTVDTITDDGIEWLDAHFEEVTDIPKNSIKLGSEMSASELKKYFYIPHVVSGASPEFLNAINQQPVNLLTSYVCYSFVGDSRRLLYNLDNLSSDTPDLTKCRFLMDPDDVVVQKKVDGVWKTLTPGTDYAFNTSTPQGSIQINYLDENGYVKQDVVVSPQIKFVAYHQTEVAGQDNIRVFFKPIYVDEMLNKVIQTGSGRTTYCIKHFKGTYKHNRMTLLNTPHIKMYGYSSMDRLFAVDGESNNTLRYSAATYPLYFPDNNYMYVGNGSKITGLTIMENKLVVFKDAANGDVGIYYVTGKYTQLEGVNNSVSYFSAIPTSIKMNPINEASIKTLINEPLFLTNNGIYGITSLYYNGELSTRNRSYKLDSKLLNEPNLKDAVATIYNGNYILSVNNHCYVLNGRTKDSDKTNNTNYTYESYYWEGVSAKKFLNYNGRLLFLYYEEIRDPYTDYLIYAGNSLGCLNTDIDDDSKYTDGGMIALGSNWQPALNSRGSKYVTGGTPVRCVWSTPLDDDGLPNYFKTLNKKATVISIKPYEKTSVKVKVVKNGYNEYKKDNTLYGVPADEMAAREYYEGLSDIFITVDFEKFSFDTNNSVRDIYLNKKIKKYKRLQIVLENDEAEPFGVIGITKTYSIGNLAK